MPILIITHDLWVVANVADEVVVMYRGEVMESGTLEDIFKAPRHPYLNALLRAVPRFHMKPGERLMPIREITQQDDSTFLGKAAAEPAARPQVREGAARETLLKDQHLSKSLALTPRGIFASKDGGRLPAASTE